MVEFKVKPFVGKEIIVLRYLTKDLTEPKVSGIMNVSSQSIFMEYDEINNLIKALTDYANKN